MFLEIDINKQNFIIYCGYNFKFRLIMTHMLQREKYQNGKDTEELANSGQYGQMKRGKKERKNERVRAIRANGWFYHPSATVVGGLS